MPTASSSGPHDPGSIGLVAALRESSVLFAVLLSGSGWGSGWGESAMAALVILCGILLIRLG